MRNNRKGFGVYGTFISPHQRAARDDDGKRIRIPSDMNYRDWKAIYIDKTKALAEWQIEFEARRKADEQSPLRLRGRAIIEQLADKSLPLPKANGNIAKGLAAGNIDLTITKGSPPKLIGKIESPTAIQKVLEHYETQIVKAPVEHAVIITKGGDIYHCSGDVHGIPLNYFEEMTAELEGAHVTHNHPPGAEENENTFSDDDFKRFLNFKMERLRGVDEKFVYELNRNPKDNELYGYDLPEIYNLGLDFGDYHYAIMLKALTNGVGYKRWLR